ncbi:MAG: GNAT family N-acetyltransferase [Planctomycetota bacterium]|jgi:ribosomal protein S18 acetylase RimI-like enzyme
MEIRRYEPNDNTKLTSLFEGCFSDSPNYWPFAAHVIDNPAFKLGGHVMFVADSDGQLVGFSHGGSQGIYCVGVRPEHRRQGIGRKLIAALKLSLGPETKFDSRCENPFWGNSVNINTVPFGSVEGVGVSSDAPYSAFFEALGATKWSKAVTMSVDAERFNADRAKERRQVAEARGFEFGMLQNRAPEVGSLLSAQQDSPLGRYFTATALYGQVVAGRCIAFAQPELGEGHFGFWDFDVVPDHRRKGVGSALVWNAMLEMQAGAFTRCEATTVSTENRHAVQFYESLGFTRSAEFDLYE